VRIALVGARTYPAKHGGLEVVVEELASELCRGGHEVHVYVGDSGESARDNVRVHTSRAVRTKHFHTISQVVSAIADIRRLKADVVHVHGVGPAIPLILGKRIFGAPALVTAHGIDWERAKWGRSASNAFRMLSVRAIKNADALTAVSQTTARELSAAVLEEVHVVSNGVRQPISAAPSLPFLTPYVVAVARLTPEKNVDWLARVYSAEFERVFGKLHVIGAGAGSYTGGYAAKVASFCGASVVLEGALPHEETLAHVARASVFVSASALEAQPMAVLEAMSVGTPVCLSDIGAHREVAGDAGVYFPEGDSHAFLEALRLCLADRERLSAAVRDRALEFSWASVAARYEKIYSQLGSVP
jgi:glycosyltransferase involved in cell wall biosynthesis